MNETSYPNPADRISAQEQMEQIINSLKRLVVISEENDINHNSGLYQAVVEMLDISIGYMDGLWQNQSIQDLGIACEDWNLYRELVAYSRDNIIDLYESVIPFTKYLIESLTQII